MSIDLNISLDRANLARFRRLLTANRTIAAQSLTFTAERAQEAWRGENHRLFHMRRPWIDKGVRIKHATAGNLVAQVGTIDRYMGRHVKGVDEAKRASGKALVVPTQAAADQGTHTQFRAKLRQMARTKSKPFVRHGNLLRRVGSGLKLLAVFRRTVQIAPRLDALETVGRAVQTNYGPVYERLLLKMVASGRV